MASSPQNDNGLAENVEVEGKLRELSRDGRTVDGKMLYIQVTILEPELIEKDGEKFMVYPISTEVREEVKKKGEERRGRARGGDFGSFPTQADDTRTHRPLTAL